MKRLILVFIVLNTLTMSLLAQDVLTFSGNKGLTTKSVSSILTEAYRRIGIRFQYKIAPSARSLKMANLGKVDGETCRFIAIEKNYLNLIRVPVVIYPAELSVFTMKKEVSIEEWESLRNYRIGIRIGDQFVETKFKDMEVAWRATTHTELFKMLEAGRLDIVAGVTRFGGLKIIRELRKKQNFQFKGLRILQLKRIPGYHYLHLKNKELVPRITSALKEMEHEGLIRKMHGAYEATLMK